MSTFNKEPSVNKEVSFIINRGPISLQSKGTRRKEFILNVTA